ncbi:ADP-heptose--lipooligosaccharide heptosyltransferase II [Olavius sp. associated proteobacterium Delta 1]|nr:ADP-heptose--lipooligosaccharide heptosyltransferase II [Olavius sp. associated proteobacterium Delta 1]
MKIETQRFIDRYVGTLICRLFSMYYRLFKKDSDTVEPQKILIILLSEMGALVLAHPMFQRLKEKYPRSDLYVMLFEKNREVVELLGIVPAKNIITIKDSSMLTFIRDTQNGLSRMRKLKFDTVIDCELFSRISSILAFLSGAAVRVGFHPHTQEGLYRGNFMNRPVPYNPYHHISRQFLTLVEAIDSETHPRAKHEVVDQIFEIPAIRIEAQEIENERKNLFAEAPELEDKKIVLIYPGGGLLPIRAWPLENYCTLTEELLNRGYAVCIIGLNQDKEIARLILSHSSSRNCVDLTGYTKTIRQLMLIFHFSSLLITNDGGPGHFAAMTPIPAIIFYGPETPALYGPLDEKALNIFLGLSCSPCVTAYNHRNSPCDGDNLCLKKINPNEVLAHALEILEG